MWWHEQGTEKEERRAGEPRWALAIVVGALVLLTIVPTAIGSQARARRFALWGSTEEARGWITQVHLHLAIGRSAVRNYLATRDSAYLSEYHTARSQEQRAYRELRLAARHLPEAALSELQAVEAQSSAWHTRVAEMLSMEAPAISLALAQDNRYETVLLGVARLDQAVATEAWSRNQEIATSEEWARRSRYILVLVALAATAALMRIARQMRGFANEAERSRVERARSAEAKARMMRGLAHDVKNPLSAIHGYADVLEMGLKGELNAEQKRCLRRIEDSVQAAVRMIDALLDLARLEAGQLEYRSVITSVDTLVRDVVEQYLGAFENGRVRLQIDLPDQLPEAAIDPDRASEIIGNLLSNALKYTPSGGSVTVRAGVIEARSVDDSGGYITIEVEDNGPGIAEAEQEKIFDEFTRLSNGSGAPGAGLGLTISRRMARQMGGDLRVRSEPGGGAAFSLLLPATGPVERNRRVLAGRDVRSKQ